MLDKISNGLIKASAAGLIIMVFVISWQVFGRFILNSSPSWSDQVALILMIWYIFFAAAAGVHERFHIRITALEDMSSPAMAKKLRIAIHIITAIFGMILLIFGAQLVWLVQIHVIPALGISRSFAYLPLPISGLLMTIFAIRHTINDWNEPVNETLDGPKDAPLERNL